MGNAVELFYIIDEKFERQYFTSVDKFLKFLTINDQCEAGHTKVSWEEYEQILKDSK